MGRVKKKPDLVVHPVQMVDIDTLRSPPYNPRRITHEEFLGICYSITHHGFADAITITEDGLIVGGNNRIDALRYVLAGKYKENGKVVSFVLPNNEVPASIVTGKSTTDQALLNVALNSGGDWDGDKLKALVDQLAEDTAKAADEILGDLNKNGFVGRDFDRFFGNNRGRTAQPLKRAPKLTLEFSSKAKRDAFKAYVAAQCEDNPETPSGDVLGGKLGIID